MNIERILKKTCTNRKKNEKIFLIFKLFELLNERKELFQFIF